VKRERLLPALPLVRHFQAFARLDDSRAREESGHASPFPWRRCRSVDPRRGERSNRSAPRGSLPCVSPRRDPRGPAPRIRPRGSDPQVSLSRDRHDPGPRGRRAVRRDDGGAARDPGGSAPRGGGVRRRGMARTDARLGASLVSRPRHPFGSRRALRERVFALSVPTHVSDPRGEAQDRPPRRHGGGRSIGA
jgi:hypothetical protein